MQEFSSISVSSYEAGSLAEQLTEQSRDGWHVVAIVPTGSTVTAYLSREADLDTIPPAAVAQIDEPAAETEPEAAADEPAEPAEPFFATTATAITPEPAAEPAPETTSAVTDVSPADSPADVTPETVDAAATTDTAAAAGAAPAGWYADPSGRFELRYWDGGQWTEHVSRAGQQYTDPPVA